MSQQRPTPPSFTSFAVISTSGSFSWAKSAFGALIAGLCLLCLVASASASSIVFKNQCQRPIDVVYTIINSTENVQIQYKERMLLEEDANERRRLANYDPDDRNDEEEEVWGPSVLVCQLQPGSSCMSYFDSYAMSGGQVTAGRRGKTAARFGWDFFSGAEWYDNYRLSRSRGFDVGMQLIAPNNERALVCRHPACAHAGDSIPFFTPTGGTFTLVFCP